MPNPDYIAGYENDNNDKKWFGYLLIVYITLSICWYIYVAIYNVEIPCTPYYDSGGDIVDDCER